MKFTTVIIALFLAAGTNADDTPPTNELQMERRQNPTGAVKCDVSQKAVGECVVYDIYGYNTGERTECLKESACLKTGNGCWLRKIWIKNNVGGGAWFSTCH
ncbi:hypothetical protein E6O75_ATG03474 [Venturia nashicola]|uniref:Uncharacterized protein n=1 Tax=Venturia nashicola TaxID=86259 RepID=A0A4Z1PIQ4_9PEZI|nr:hypothetical protein E6O75_ATG03474 [Venturia nashicola]